MPGVVCSLCENSQVFDSTFCVEFIERGQEEKPWSAKDMRYFNNLTKTLNVAVMTARAFRNDPEIADQMQQYISNLEPIVDGIRTKKNVTVPVKGKSAYLLFAKKLSELLIENYAEDRTCKAHDREFSSTIKA